MRSCILQRGPHKLCLTWDFTFVDIGLKVSHACFENYVEKVADTFNCLSLTFDVSLDNRRRGGIGNMHIQLASSPGHLRERKRKGLVHTDRICINLITEVSTQSLIDIYLFRLFVELVTRCSLLHAQSRQIHFIPPCSRLTVPVKGLQNCFFSDACYGVGEQYCIHQVR